MKFEECLEAIKTVAREEAESLGCETEKHETAPISKNAYTIVYSSEAPKVDIKVFVREIERIELTYWRAVDEEQLKQLCCISCYRNTDADDSFALQGGTFSHGNDGKHVLLSIYEKLIEKLEK